MKRILCVYHDFLEERHLSAIREKAAALGFSAEMFDSRIPDEKERVYDVIPRAEIIYGRSLKALRAAGPNLRWYCCMNAGVEPFIENPEAFPSCDVILTNSNVYGAAISEYVIGALLTMMRRFRTYEEIANRREWTRNLPVDGIVGNTFIVAGTGDLGGNIACRLRGMRAGRVIGLNRSGQYQNRARLPECPFDDIHPLSELDAYLPLAKGVIFAVPNLPETTAVLNERTIALLPEDAYVVNVGRGNAVDEASLVRALNEERIAGAALDVFREEPLPEESPLWNAKNIFITPHISGDTSLPYTKDLNVARFLEDFENYAAGKPLAGFVDRKRGY